MLSYQVMEWGAPLEPREVPTPDPKGTEVLVRISACGVCHSDLHIWDGYFDLGGGKRAAMADRGVYPPFTMGHEIVGEVAALGPEASGVEVGARRVVFPWIGCRGCAVCERGDELLCVEPKYLGTRVHGGYSDHVLVPHPSYLIDYEGTPADLACTYACAGLTAYGALKKLSDHLGEDDHYLIVGAGGVGLSAVHIAKTVLKGRMIVADVDPAKREAALAAGADEAIDNAAPDAMRTILDMTGGGVAAAADFVGAPITSKFGMNALGKGGLHVVVGLYGDELPMSLPLFPFKMMTVRGSFTGTLGEMAELMALVKAGKVPPIPIEPRPMARVNEALDDLKAGRVVGRVVLNP